MTVSIARIGTSFIKQLLIAASDIEASNFNYILELLELISGHGTGSKGGITMQ